MASSVFSAVRNRIFSTVFKNAYNNPFGPLPWYQDGWAATAVDGTTVYPSWIFDGVNQRYAKSASPTGTVSEVAFTSFLERFTRASNATYFDSTGTLRTATTNESRFTYNPATLQPLGFLVEESRTNYIRNNTNSGAVEGSSGSLPSGWTNTLRGLSRSIRLGTERGIPVIYIRLTGTPTSTGEVNVIFEPTANTAATNSQAWSMSAFVARTAGSFTNVTSPRLQLNVFSDPSTYLTTIISQSLSAVTSSLTRYGTTGTTPAASSAYVQPLFAVNVTSGQTVDFEIALGLPQNEIGSTISSPIPTSGSTVTRASDVPYTEEISWYNQGEGTVIVKFEFVNGIAAVGSGDGPLQFYNQVGVSPQTRNEIRRSTSTGDLSGLTFVSGGIQTNLAVVTNSSLQANYSYSIGHTWASDNFACCANGGTILTDGTGLVPNNIIGLRIGRIALASTYALNGTIAMILYYPKRLTDAEIQRLTA